MTLVKARVLLIEDDLDLAQTIKDEFERDYQVELADDGLQGEDLALSNNYDLAIVDLSLPGKNGLEICRSLRKEKLTLPILILTGEASLPKKVAALDGGADDYLTKPFSFEELKARMRALLRRNRGEFSDVLVVGDLSLDLGKKEVCRAGRKVSLRRKELALLEYLMKNVGRVVTRDMILSQIWRGEGEPLYNTVDVHVKYLRDKIDRRFSQKIIKTVYGFGYKIELNQSKKRREVKKNEKSR
jgi:DNA-binding response OmpR family regulator